MKIISIIMIALVGTLILNLPMQSYADPQLDTLLRIATQARDNLSINLSQITNIPSDISNLYKKGSDETDALNQAVQQQDVGSAKQHFLSAMQFFKTTNDKINSLNATALNDQQQAQILTLQDQINSIQNTGNRLKDIAATNNVDANFTEFDQLIQQAKQDLSNNNTNATTTDIQNLGQVISDIHHYLATIAQQRTSDRAKDFTEKQIERLGTESTNVPSNTTSQAPLTTSANVNATTEESPQEMVAKVRTLISQGKIDEAIQELKVLQETQKKKLESSSNESASQQNNSITESNQNHNHPFPNTNPNNINNSTTSENETSHDHHPFPNTNPNNINNSTRTSANNENNSGKVNQDKFKGSEKQGNTVQNPVNSPTDNSQNIPKNNHGKNDGEKGNNNKRANHSYHED